MIKQPNKFKQNTQNRPRQTQTGATASALLTGKKEDRKCTYCSKDYDEENCQEVRDITERKNVLLRHAKCFSCLRSGHRMFKWRSHIDYKICKKSGHRVSICPRLSAPSAVQEAQPKPTVGRLNPVPLLNPGATSWVGSTDSSE